MLYILVLFIFTGCSVKLTPAAKNVKEITIDMQDKCEYLGTEQITGGSAVSLEGLRKKTHNIMLNTIAERGGNAYLLLDGHVYEYGSYMKFKMYRCPSVDSNIFSRWVVFYYISE